MFHEYYRIPINFIISFEGIQVLQIANSFQKFSCALIHTRNFEFTQTKDF